MVPNWLNDAIFYEIYPQSFYDTNGDGIGDLEGIIQKLDYIKSLNADVIWLNPCFLSPFRDAGYDISDFYQIAPRYGTNEDMRRLCEEAHKRGMRVILDLVAGHTSSEHPRFKASCENKLDSEDYIWTDGWDAPQGDFTFIRGFAKRDGFFLSNFFYCQPALDYGFEPADPALPWQRPVDHPAIQRVRQELKNIMAFWLDLGCDGFRVDMASSLVRGRNAAQGIRKLWNEYRAWLEEHYPQAILISEWGQPDKALPAGFHVDFMLFFGQKGYSALTRGEKNIASNSQFAQELSQSFFSEQPGGDATIFLTELAENLRVARENNAFIGLPTGNHDMCRMCFNGRTPEQLKAIYAFLMLLPGLPFIYYGDEIGMKSLYGLGNVEGSYNRSCARTPMQWSNDSNAGFSTADASSLYLPVDSDPQRPTVSAQEDAPGSLLNFVRRVLALRKASPALKPDADYRVLHAEKDASPVIYERQSGSQRFVIAVNPVRTAAETLITLPGVADFKLVEGTEGVSLVDLNGATKVILPPCSFAIWQA